LIVDDEEMLSGMLKKMLEKEGYRILTARSGPEAITCLKSQQVDLLLTDVKMPEMDGFQLLKQVKHDFPEVGVIVMTAFGDSFTVRDALLMGADEYITKPFKSYEIIMVVERASWRIASSRSSGRAHIKQG